MCVIVELRMNLLNIVKYPHEVLAKEAEPVAVVDDEVRRLVDDMVKTMKAAGAGLAEVVILFSFLGIGQNFMGFADFFETFFRFTIAGVFIRMIFFS